MSGIELFALPAILGGGSATLGGVASVAGLLGTGLQIAGSLASADAQSSADKANAAIATQNATIANQQANAQEEQQRRKARQILGQQRAAIGESYGGLLGSGADLYQQSSTNAELDALNIRYEGVLKSRGYQQQAAFDRASASNALSAGYVGAGAALLSGAADYARGYDLRNPKNTRLSQ